MKRKMLNKVIALGMSAAMTAGMLTGCGSSDVKDAAADDGAKKETEDTADDETKDTEEKDTAKTDGEVPTLTWWTVGGTTPTDYEDSLEKINEYLVEKVGVKIDIKVAGWGDYDQKMNTIVNSGEQFDMMFVNSSNYNKFVNLGAMADLTEILPTAVPELYEFIPENLWKGVQIKGSIYGVPTYKDSSCTQFHYIDDQYVQKYDIDMSTLDGSFESLDPVFRKMKDGEGKSFYPVQLNQGALWNGFFNGYDDLTSGVQGIGVKIDDESRKVVCTLEQEDIMNNLKILHQWYVDGIVNPDANVLTEGGKGAPFGNAQGWPSAVSAWQDVAGVEKYDAVQVADPLYTTGTIQGSINAISANSEHKEEALKVLQLANTDSKFRDMLAYGVEGDHFEYVSDGVIKKNRDDWPLAAYTQATFFIMSITEDADPDQWDQVRKQNEEAISSVCLGFVMDVSNLQNEIANTNSVFDKYKYDMLTGASDPETAVPQCIKEMKAAGLDTIIAEAQKQVDEYFQ